MLDKEESNPEGLLIDDIKLSEQKEYKYVDIELGYQFETQGEIDSIVSAVNSFINAHKNGLRQSSINILGYSYNY